MLISKVDFRIISLLLAQQQNEAAKVSFLANKKVIMIIAVCIVVLHAAARKEISFFSFAFQIARDAATHFIFICYALCERQIQENGREREMITNSTKKEHKTHKNWSAVGGIWKKKIIFKWKKWIGECTDEGCPSPTHCLLPILSRN